MLDSNELHILMNALSDTVLLCGSDNSAAVEARRREREAHERAMQAQRLENLGMLSSGIAHDFRNLLTAVLGNAELAMLEMPEPHPLREYVQAIELAANHLRDMSTQILDVACNSEGKRQAVDVPHVAQEMCALLRSSLPVGIRWSSVRQRTCRCCSPIPGSCRRYC